MWRSPSARVPVVAVIVLLGAGCGSDSSMEPPPSGPPSGNAVAPVIEPLPNAFDGFPAVAGDTLNLLVSATDDIATAWIGWRAGPPLGGADSSQVLGIHRVSAMLRIPVHDRAVGQSAITVWARDCSDLGGHCDPAEVGNRTELPLGSLEVVAVASRPLRSLPLADWTSQTAFDGKRNRLYFAVRELSRVDVLSMADGAWLPSMPMPGPPAALDLTPGDDTLVVALRDRAELAVVGLTGAAPQVSVAPIVMDTTYRNAPWDLKVTPDRHVLVTQGSYLASLAFPLLAYELIGGTQEERREIGFFGNIRDRSRIFRSADRTRFLIAQADVCCPVTGNVYDPATDTFGADTPIAFDFFNELSMDRTGERYLISNVLFDRSLTPLAIADPAQFAFEFGVAGAQAISPDGTTLYFGTRYGFLSLDAGTGAIVERVRLPSAPSHLYLTPDGLTLVARTDRAPGNTAQVFLVDLGALPDRGSAGSPSSVSGLSPFVRWPDRAQVARQQGRRLGNVE